MQTHMCEKNSAIHNIKNGNVHQTDVHVQIKDTPSDPLSLTNYNRDEEHVSYNTILSVE